MPLLVTTGATYSLVNGKHRYVWSNAGTYQFYLKETIAKPTLSITGGNVDTSITPVLNGTAFSSNMPGSLHANTDWEIATDAGFTNIVYSSLSNATNKTSVTASGLSYGTSYYARCRYNGAYTSSAWSDAIQFNVISTLTATITLSSRNNYSLRQDLITNYGWNQTRPVNITYLKI